MIYRHGQLGDFTSDLNAALATRLPKQTLATITNTKKKKTPGTTVKALLQPAPKTTPTIATVPANFGTDELIAGARLQWSVMLGLPYDIDWKLPRTEFAEKTDALRKLIGDTASTGLRQVHVTTSNWDSLSFPLKQYAGKFVVEVTTTMNRARKTDVQWDLEQMAQRAGLLVDPNPAHNNLALMKQGSNGTQGGLPAENYIAPDGKPPKDEGWDAFLKGLGLSTPWALIAGAAVIIAILRR